MVSFRQKTSVNMDRRMYKISPFSTQEAIAFATANKIQKKQKGPKIKYQSEKYYSYGSLPKYQQTYKKPNESYLRQLLFDKDEQDPKEQININKPATVKQSFLVQKKIATASTLSQRMNQFANIRDQQKSKLSMIQQAFLRQTQDCLNQKSYQSFGQTYAQHSASFETNNNLQNRFNDPAQSLLKNLLKRPEKKLDIDVISLSSGSEDQKQNKANQKTFPKEQQQLQKSVIKSKTQAKDKYCFHSQKTPPLFLVKKSVQKNDGKYQLPLLTPENLIPLRYSQKKQQKKIIKNSKQQKLQKHQRNSQQAQVNKQVQQDQMKVSDDSKQPKWNAKKMVQCVSKNSASQKIKFAQNIPQESFEFNDDILLKKADFYVNINILPAQKKQGNAVYPQMREFDIPQKKVMYRVNSRSFQPIPVPSKYKIGNNNKKYKQQRIDNFFNEVKEKNLKKSFQYRDQEQIILKNGEIHEPETVETPQCQSTPKVKRSWKYPKLHHPLTIQGQIKQVNNNYDDFLQRRMCLRGQPRDLGVLSLDQIIVQCYERGIIWQEIYVQYIKRTSKGKDIQFANLFIEGRINQWNYEELKITLLDHRRLAQLLAKLFPSDYALMYPHALQKEVNEFLTNIYLLSNSDYQILLQSIDQTSKLNIWKVINLKYKQRLGVLLKIRPYKPRVAAERPEIKWRYSCGNDAKYTEAELKAMKNYRFTREKIKTNTSKESAYCDETLSESSSSSISSERSVYAPVNTQPSKDTIKKSSKGKVQSLARRMQ